MENIGKWPIQNQLCTQFPRDTIVPWLHYGHPFCLVLQFSEKKGQENGRYKPNSRRVYPLEEKSRLTSGPGAVAFAHAQAGKE